MSFGLSDTPTGYAGCLLQEDGMPLMLATKPFEYAYQAERALRILTASSRSPLALAVTDALRRAEIFEPLAVQVW